LLYIITYPHVTDYPLEVHKNACIHIM